MTFLEKCIGVLAILVFMLITGVAKAEDKTVTPQEFVKTVSEVLKVKLVLGLLVK